MQLIAFDSFGIKSSCFFIKGDDVNLVIDPGVAYETDSFPLSWAKRMWLLARYERKIRKVCKKSDVIIITHYHYDHHIPDQDIYEDKILLIKDPKKNINRSQKSRAAELLNGLKADVRIADGKSFRFGDVKLEFTKPLWHGVKNTNLGFVIALTIDYKKRIFYSSDLDGPYLFEYAKLIVRKSPQIIILDGPPTYLLGYLMAYYNLARAIINVNYIIRNSDFELMLLDHHLLRDYRYKDLLYEVYALAEKLGKNVMSAAEYLGEKPMVLKGYEKNGPTKWRDWQRFTRHDIENVIKQAVRANLIEKEWLKRVERYV